jgi:hypothetical protein
MSKKEKYKIIIFITILITSFFILFFFYSKLEEIPPSLKQEINIKNKIPPILKEKNITVNNITLEINENTYKSKIEKEISIYDFMNKLKNEGKINFKDKTYSGMGKFIEEINGIKPNNEKYWIYYVNNKKANIGISDYKIKPGDVVSWKLEKI